VGVDEAVRIWAKSTGGGQQKGVWVEVQEVKSRKQGIINSSLRPKPITRRGGNKANEKEPRATKD
jgi:hypothetical protein